jgi:putative FmdB family regulatory protein
MPIFEYTCKDCNSDYEILHKTKENLDDVVCPICKSKKHVKLISSFSSVISSGKSGGCDSGSCGMPQSFNGGCQNGMCGMN